MLCSKRGTRLLLPSNTGSGVSVVDGREDIGLGDVHTRRAGGLLVQPEVSALTDSGYASGTVCCFSTSTPARAPREGVRVRRAGREGASGVEFHA